jgi:phosphonate transport system substrate-binding protein
MTVTARTATTALQLSAGFDTFLNFPETDPYWAPFFAGNGCSLSSFTNLNELTLGLLAGRFAFSYLPSANCFFLRHDPNYQGLVSALTFLQKKPSQNSVFVVKASNPATRWQELRGVRYGYINTFCTTSFFSPSILLARQGQSLTTFFDAFAVPAWQGQIDAVIDGKIDATMVYEDVWLARPENAKQTKIIDRLDDLPTNPFILPKNLDAAFVADLKGKLIGYSPKAGSGQLYAGVAEYQGERMQRFFAEMEELPSLAGQ